jgi:hypothetical protein
MRGRKKQSLPQNLNNGNVQTKEKLSTQLKLSAEGQNNTQGEESKAHSESKTSTNEEFEFEPSRNIPHASKGITE